MNNFPFGFGCGVVVGMLLIGVAFPAIFASGPERDYDEAYEDVPGAPECWYDGYEDGQDNPFNHDRNKECIDKGNQYYRAFIHGCMAADNTKEICEKFTDA